MQSVKQNSGTILSLLILLAVFSTCKKPVSFPDEPEITDVQVSKTFADLSVSDTMLIQIFFTDGDGDIGLSDDDNVHNQLLVDDDYCFLGLQGEKVDSSNGVKPWRGNVLATDSRSGCTLPAETPLAPEKGNVKAITGTIFINQSLFCKPNKVYDTIIYTFRILDRANHFSNAVSTPPIILKCK